MTSDSIEFHDGHLVGHHLESDGSLCLQIQLDNVWNDGSSRIVGIMLLDISDVPAVERYFAPIKIGPRQGDAPTDGTTWHEAEPTVLQFEMLGLDGRVLVSLDLLMWGVLNIICERVESDERSSFRFVG